MKLTPKQQKFCDEYLKSGNATQAYTLAYSTKNMGKQSISVEAHKTLKKPSIQAYINDRMNEESEHKIASAQEVLAYLTRVFSGQETETVTTPRGVIIPNVPVKASDRLSAAKELLKRYPTDPIAAAKLDKIRAETALTRAKVKAMEALTSDDNAKLNELLDKVTQSVNDEYSND
ncbi:terminase small subunit [Lactobacillus sp.]|uniref:terminase small subunit n=1 Tax=Lactobacillus sp. TaxID=1591 RepID=UPI001994A89C|nr:terminase small subunit [Lactobacillus sp.]MBD5429334.1 terminase small subunit [Lactobacillus sp.]MBD5430009.1 terminase small subunit [Lactobacillus sp.]